MVNPEVLGHSVVVALLTWKKWKQREKLRGRVRRNRSRLRRRRCYIDLVRHNIDIMLKVYDYLPINDRFFTLSTVDKTFRNDIIRGGSRSFTYGGTSATNIVGSTLRWVRQDILRFNLLTDIKRIQAKSYMEEWLFRMQIRQGRAILRERLEKTTRILIDLRTLAATPKAMLPDWWPQTDDGVYSEYFGDDFCYIDNDEYSDVLNQMIVKHNFQVDFDLFLKSKHAAWVYGKDCLAREVYIEYSTDDGTDRIGKFRLCSHCSAYSGSGLVRQGSCNIYCCGYAVCKSCLKQKVQNEHICPYCTKQAGKIERKDVDSMDIWDVDYDDISCC